MTSRPDFMLDTNIVSELIRNPLGKAAARIERLGDESVCVSIVVAAHACALRLPLVTADPAFRRVNGLRVENWLE